MKKPILLFAIKCSVILYFAACTGINEYTTAVSATPHVTKGTWKVNVFTESQQDKTNTFSGYSLVFESNGIITATKNGNKITGNWAEDNIHNRITINLNTKDPALTKLNRFWNISNISNAALDFQNTKNPADGRFQITSL